MASVLFFCPWWWLWLLGGHLDFLCCDPGGGAFLGWSGLPPWHLGPQCPILLHLEQWVSCAWQFALPAGCCWVQLDSPLRVQMVCDHGCCGWYGPSALCPGGLCPQVWSFGRLVPWHVGWQSGSQQCQPAHWRVS